jgi:predicted Zn-dependent protease
VNEGGLIPSKPPARSSVRGLRHSGVGKRLSTAARGVAGFLALVALAGCISDEREEQIGSTMASEVNPHLPLIQDPLLIAYVQTVGRQIGTVRNRPELEYTFYLVNTDIVNAFALPGGHIYLTRGLISRMENGSEFAGAIAHEIGHVAARHGVQKLQRELRTGSLVSVLYNTILGGEPAILRENSLQLADMIWTAEHSRRDEEEADRLAVRYLAAAGVDPEGVVTLLETLLREEQADSSAFSRLETWLSSHPLTRDRIAVARDAIDDLDGNLPATANINGFDQFRELVVRAGPPDTVPPPTFPSIE